MVASELIELLFHFFIKSILYVIVFMLTWGMFIRCNDITPTTIKFIYDIQLLTNSNF